MENVPLDQFQIPEPCGKNWNVMPGDHGRRHCDACNKSVFNFVELPRDQAETLANSGACARINRTRQGRIITRDDIPLERLRGWLERRGIRWVSRLIVVPAMLALGACGWGAGGLRPIRPTPGFSQIPPDAAPATRPITAPTQQK